ncbi:peptidoglycan DD-metalloendopeptidase family protein [bacterium]|nr:peptidoglycan DD-metalloendopeptidase family protein [bacterium]
MSDDIATKDLQKLTVKGKEAEVKLKIAEKDARNLLFKIGKNQLEIKNYERKIAQKELKINNTQKALVKIEEVLVKAEKDLKKRKSILALRLVSIYKVKTRKLVDSVLASDDLNELLKRYKYFSEIIKEDNKIILSLKKARNYYKQTLNEIYSKKKELESLIQINNDLKNKMLEKEKSLKKLFERATRKKTKLNEQILAMRSEEKSLKKKIKEDLSRDEEKRKKILEEKRKIKESKIKKIKTGKVNKKVKHRLIWPVGSIDKVVSKYGIGGIRALDIQHYNNGIDIIVQGSVDVKCSLDGIVIYKGFMNGYGNIVIVDHGNSLVTVYANLASQEVGMNEYVKQSDILGKTVKNEKFHFEIRQNSESKDPLKWLL